MSVRSSQKAIDEHEKSMISFTSSSRKSIESESKSYKSKSSLNENSVSNSQSIKSESSRTIKSKTNSDSKRNSHSESISLGSGSSKHSLPKNSQKSNVPSNNQISNSKKSISSNASKNETKSQLPIPSLSTLKNEIDGIYTDVENFLITLKSKHIPYKDTKQKNSVFGENDKKEFKDNLIRRKDNFDFEIQNKEKDLINQIGTRNEVKTKNKDFIKYGFSDDKIDNKVTFNPYSTTNPYHQNNEFKNYYREIGKDRNAMSLRDFYSKNSNQEIFDDELILEESDEYKDFNESLKKTPSNRNQKRNKPNLDLNEAINILLK